MGCHLVSFRPVEIAEGCLTWRWKAESYGCSSKCTINTLLPISWKSHVELWKRLKAGKEVPFLSYLEWGELGWF